MRNRDDLIEQVLELMRSASAQGLLIHQAIADRLGLIPSDLKCLDAIRHEGRPTAGRLAELTGLSTSAMTAALDRLERGDFVTRRRDAADRRRIVVESTGRHEAEIARLYAPLADSRRGLLLDYDEQQLTVFADFLVRLTAEYRTIQAAAAPSR